MVRQVHGTHMLDKRMACVPGRYTRFQDLEGRTFITANRDFLQLSPYFQIGAGEEAALWQPGLCLQAFLLKNHKRVRHADGDWCNQSPFSLSSWNVPRGTRRTQSPSSSITLKREMTFWHNFVWNCQNKSTRNTGTLSNYIPRVDRIKSTNSFSSLTATVVQDTFLNGL